MEKYIEILHERFSKDSLMALATVDKYIDEIIVSENSYDDSK